ncbi:hypothetical protein LTR84_008077 [Exophiala bonariae]|uniref:Uncharacterized protein n=1 Tax=Exophiala bonariae TaxID=1690606 RepID=A0AAV9NLV6_9EURO|nr:hypothetical protein LTR84_008077 [Exophiala bonariae]
MARVAADTAKHLSLFMVLNGLATVLIQGYSIRMSFEFAMAHPAWATVGYGLYLVFYYSMFVEENQFQLESLRIQAGSPTRGLLKG